MLYHLGINYVCFYVVCVYPERFGDGDTSQIGLDLEEVN